MKSKMQIKMNVEFEKVEFETKNVEERPQSDNTPRGPISIPKTKKLRVGE